MNKIIFWLLLSISSFCFSQQCDYKITTPVYTGCFSTKYKNPTVIRYKLYKGGGECSREGLTFKKMDYTASASDYAHSGYDEGHLCNAEDFAFDCEKEKLTFWFYNCVPQTPNLNRGIWKHDETSVRDISQKDSVLILCGPIYTDKSKVIGKGLYVPDYCWKFVKSLSTGKIIMCRYYTNLDADNTFVDCTKEELEKKIGFILK